MKDKANVAPCFVLTVASLQDKSKWALEIAIAAERLLYGPGIDELVKSIFINVKYILF